MRQWAQESPRLVVGSRRRTKHPYNQKTERVDWHSPCANCGRRNQRRYITGKCKSCYEFERDHGTVRQLGVGRQPCVVPGCSKLQKQFSIKLCAAHYERRRRHGDVLAHLPIKSQVRVGPGHPCQVQDCARPYLARGYCRKHYHAMIKSWPLHLMGKYGITVEEHREMQEAQGYRCAACGEKRPLVIDHDHTTGVIRGLLCSGCNVALGFVHDDCRRLLQLASYIQRFEVKKGAA